MKKTFLFLIVFFCVFLVSCIDKSVPPMQDNTEWLSEDGKIHLYFTDGPFDIGVLVVEECMIVVPIRGYTEICICPQEAFYDNTITTDVGAFTYEVLGKDRTGKCNKMKIKFIRGNYYDIGTEFVLERVAQNVMEDNLPLVPDEQRKRRQGDG